MMIESVESLYCRIERKFKKHHNKWCLIRNNDSSASEFSIEELINYIEEITKKLNLKLAGVHTDKGTDKPSARAVVESLEEKKLNFDNLYSIYFHIERSYIDGIIIVTPGRFIFIPNVNSFRDFVEFNPNVVAREKKIRTRELAKKYGLHSWIINSSDEIILVKDDNLTVNNLSSFIENINKFYDEFISYQ